MVPPWVTISSDAVKDKAKLSANHNEHVLITSLLKIFTFIVTRNQNIGVGSFT